MGFIARRECWVLTLRAKALAVVLAIGLGATTIYGAYPFLAINDPRLHDYLILEGWTISSRSVLRQTAAAYRNGHYRGLLIAEEVYGDQELDRYWYPQSHDVVDTLAKYGVPCDAVTIIAYPAVERDRTYRAATAAKEWFIRNKVPIQSADVATIGPHARRSRLLFQQAFGSVGKIGVIALTDELYDPTHWWATSEGFREVQGEAVAYLYARFYLLWR